MNNIISPDRFLSIWIFIYTIAYLLGIVPYNPILLIGIAILVFACGLVITIYSLNDKSLLLYYFTINFIGKVIPFFIIINNKLTNDDLVFTIYFILLYVIYMQIINDDIICVYRDYMQFIVDRDKGREGAIYNIYKQLQKMLLL